MKRWYVVYTHVHSETRARDNLLRQGFDAYLPQGRYWRRHARRKEIVPRPLFPRYLFVGFDVDQSSWRSIFSTIGVVHLICNGDHPTLVPNSVVDSIRSAESAGVFDDAGAVSRLQIGAAVQIARGPFSEMIGRLQSLVSGDRVRVLLDILGREVPTVVDAAEVAPA